MNLTPDLMYELLQKLDYRDIPTWCQSRPEITNFCRSERAQQYIRPFIKEEAIKKYLDSLYPWEGEQLINASIGELVTHWGTKAPIPPYFAEQFRQLQEAAAIDFVLRHPETHQEILREMDRVTQYANSLRGGTLFSPRPDRAMYNDPADQIISDIKLLKDPYGIFRPGISYNPKYKDEIEDIKYDVLKELLVSNYDLLPNIKENFAESKRQSEDRSNVSVGSLYQ